VTTGSAFTYGVLSFFLQRRIHFLEITKFAQLHRLRTTTDVDGTTIIKGSAGHIYEHSTQRGTGRSTGRSSKLGMMFMSDKFTTREAWNNRRRDGMSVGMQLHQDGDYEGSMLFDASNTKQAAAAIRITGARPKRRHSANQLAAIAAYRFKRSSPALPESDAVQNRSVDLG
jgi:hypothetical protein